MIRIDARALAPLAALVLPLAASAAVRERDAPARARITPQQARTIALRARPGRVAAVEIERERGGSGVRYAFDIVRGGATYEVGVDAATGAVLENAREPARPD